MPFGNALTSGAIIVFALSIPCHATVIYSNLGTGASYNGTSGYTVGFAGLDQAPAMPFTVPGGPGYNLTQIDIALDWQSGTNSVIVDLIQDSGGAPQGALVSSWSLTDLPGAGTSTIQSPQTISGIAGITLSGGNQYWLVVLPSDFPNGGTSIFDIWEYNSTGQTGVAAFNYGGIWFTDPNFAQGAFDVLGNSVGAVPEPNSTLLVGSALFGLALKRKLSPG